MKITLIVSAWLAATVTAAPVLNSKRDFAEPLLGEVDVSMNKRDFAEPLLGEATEKTKRDFAEPLLGEAEEKAKAAAEREAKAA